jgi:hypothetical protein
VERFFNRQSGLLVREISTEIDGGDRDYEVTFNFAAYRTWQGFQYPSSIHASRNGNAFNIKVESVSLSPYTPADALILPHEVVRAIADHQSAGSSLPNPVALLDRFIEVTGDKDSQDGIRSEIVKADVTFENVGVKASLVMYEKTAGKQYMSFDLPGGGKFESGSDGTYSWERSVVLGPRLVPRSQLGSGLLGVDRPGLLKSTALFETMEKASKEDVNGSPCYLVRARAGQDGGLHTTFCFDVSTGYMVRMTSRVTSEMGETSEDSIMSDYRTEGPIKMAHHIQTKTGGQPVSIDITSVAINVLISERFFDMPEDVLALLKKRSGDAAKASGQEAHPAYQSTQPKP